MAASMTFAYHRHGPVNKLVATWTSAAGGAVSGTTTEPIVGYLLKCITNPGAAAPTDNYDIAITDEESVDVLANCTASLGNRDTANTEVQYFNNLDATPAEVSLRPCVCDRLTFAVTNAGDTKAGTITLFWGATGG